jgi:biopolymer transport protein ExbB/TolQ
MEPQPVSPKPAVKLSPSGNPSARPILGKSLLGRRGGQKPSISAAEPGKGERPVLVSLSWNDEDIENRWGIFKGGRYTSTNKVFTFILAAIISTVFLAGLAMPLSKLPEANPLKQVGEVFVKKANLWTTIPATLFFFWGVVIVCLKFSKLRLQRRALELAAVPQHHDFILNEATAKTVLERMRSLVDDTRHFILLNRIDRALSNLHNIGGVSDVSTILKSQADNDENQIASSYALIHAMIWAIPVLGFVGTVMGLSMAMANFQLGSLNSAEEIAQRLPNVVSGLSTAFQTTLVGLVFALLLHLFQDLMQQRETDFLDECNDYCHANVVSKLRVRRGGSD